MRKIALVLFAVAALAVSGCNKNVPAVGRLEVQPRSVALPFGQLTTVHLAWTPLAALPGDAGPAGEPTVFLHLIDAKGKLLRTFDHPYPQPWSEGAPVAYDVKLYQSALAPPLAAGSYRLSVGLYDHAGKRWPLDGLGEAIGRREYLAANVEVPAEAEAPRVAFSPEWLPAEAGSDLQVLARRWLGTDPGTVRVEGIGKPGAVWMMIRIPEGEGAGEKLVLHDGGSNAPSAMVRSTCGGAETGLSGPGRHEVEMPIDAPGAGGSCSFTVTPNFHLISTSSPQLHSVSLESIAWVGGLPAGASPAAAGTSGAAGTSATPATTAPPAASSTSAAPGGPAKPPPAPQPQRR